MKITIKDGGKVDWIDRALTEKPSILEERIMHGIPMGDLTLEQYDKKVRKAYREARDKIKERTGKVPMFGEWVQWEGSLEKTIVAHSTPPQTRRMLMAYMLAPVRFDIEKRTKQMRYSLKIWNQLLVRIEKETGKVPLGDEWV
jgi:hypothetical protein